MQPATKMWEQSLVLAELEHPTQRDRFCSSHHPCWHRPMEGLGEGAGRSQVALGMSTSLPLSHVLGHLVALDL